MTSAKKRNKGGNAGVISKGRITIPKQVVSALSLKTGDKVAWTVVDGRLIGTPRNLEFADLAGFLGDPLGGPAALEEIDVAVRDVVGRHVVGDRLYDKPEGTV